MYNKTKKGRVVVACNRSLGLEGSPVAEFYASWLIFPWFMNHTDHHSVNMACSQGTHKSVKLNKRCPAHCMHGFHYVPC